MNKQEFLAQLRHKLSGLPQEDVEERVTFYREMIEDRIEEGLSEKEAVAAVGHIDEIVAQILADIPLVETKKKSAKTKKRLDAWQIILLAVGSPIWLSLGIAAIAVILSLYISMWAIIISLWAVYGALLGCAFGGVALGFILVCSGNALPGTALIGSGMVFGGLSVFMFYGCKAAARGVVTLTKSVLVKRGKRNG